MGLGLIFVIYATAQCAHLKKVRGEVFVHREGKAYRAKSKTDLQCQDTVVTGKRSRAQIQLVDSKISLGSRTRFQVEKIASQVTEDSTLSLIYGKLRGLYKKKNSAGLNVKTPTAIAGVRGTDFVLEFDPNTEETKQTTLTGEVLIRLLTSSNSQLVKAGEKVTMNLPVVPTFMIANVGAPKKKKKKLVVREKIEQDELDEINSELGFD